jgi:hypothetical protein
MAYSDPTGKEKDIKLTFWIGDLVPPLSQWSAQQSFTVTVIPSNPWSVVMEKLGNTVGEKTRDLIQYMWGIDQGGNIVKIDHSGTVLSNGFTGGSNVIREIRIPNGNMYKNVISKNPGKYLNV